MTQINLVRAGYRSVIRGALRAMVVAVAGVAIATGGAAAVAPAPTSW